jgi:DNA polymerase-3 subunit delta'
MDDQENDFSQKFAPFINERNVIQLFREFETAFTDISMNGNAKLIFTDLGLKVSKLIRL